jgi:hypothetical protein
MKRTFTVTAKLWQWSGDMSSWHFMYVPKYISEILRTHYSKSAMIKCKFTIGDTTWDSSMFRNNREKNYLIPVKKSVRKAEDLFPGEEITVKIEVL